jgi:dihydropteroate synthase
MNDNYKYRFGQTRYDLTSRTFVMGILNVTPDSFYDGGKYTDVNKAVAYAKKMQENGADFIDVGGQSSRPGSEEISVEEELRRVIPVLKKLKDKITVPISIDTYRSGVAEEALSNGALIVNDISAFNMDAEMPKVISKHKASCILMHMKGTPKNMQDKPVYEDILAEVLLYFEKAIWKANVEGIDQVIIDPGIGFGKTTEHNLSLIKNMYELKKLDCPVMIGVSRKSFIGKISDADVNERLSGTIAFGAISILNGVNILRVHDVKEAVLMAKIVDAYKTLDQ